jgi:poly(A) polymerase
MREIWAMQPRFERRSGSAPHALVEQPRFRAGYDFLRLRADADEVEPELAEWWEDFSLGTLDERDALLKVVREATPPRRVPRRGASAQASAGASEEGADSPADALSSEDAPPRKRRRRRRKPAGPSAAPAGDEAGSDSASKPS